MMTAISESDIKKGQAVYSPLMLKIYDIWVLSISNSWIWRCSKHVMQCQYDQLVSANHLDIGIGTGYYLDNCRSSHLSKLALMDLNPNCLEMTSQRLRAYHPKTYHHDIFKPKPELANTFSSISMNYLLHCLPGSPDTKALAVKNAVSMLAPKGVLFGATILSDAHLHTNISTRLANFYQKKGVFSNQLDTEAGLKLLFSDYLTDLEFSVEGCVLLFKGVRK